MSNTRALKSIVADAVLGVAEFVALITVQEWKCTSVFMMRCCSAMVSDPPLLLSPNNISRTDFVRKILLGDFGRVG